MCCQHRARLCQPAAIVTSAEGDTVPPPPACTEPAPCHPSTPALPRRSRCHPRQGAAETCTGPRCNLWGRGHRAHPAASGDGKRLQLRPCHGGLGPAWPPAPWALGGSAWGLPSLRGGSCWLECVERAGVCSPDAESLAAPSERPGCAGSGRAVSMARAGRLSPGAASPAVQGLPGSGRGESPC